MRPKESADSGVGKLERRSSLRSIRSNPRKRKKRPGSSSRNTHEGGRFPLPPRAAGRCRGDDGAREGGGGGPRGGHRSIPRARRFRKCPGGGPFSSRVLFPHDGHSSPRCGEGDGTGCRNALGDLPPAGGGGGGRSGARFLLRPLAARRSGFVVSKAVRTCRRGGQAAGGPCSRCPSPLSRDPGRPERSARRDSLLHR